MSRRLAQMTEENIEQGGRSAQRAVEEAGFSEELRKSLELKAAMADLTNVDGDNSRTQHTSSGLGTAVESFISESERNVDTSRPPLVNVQKTTLRIPRSLSTPSKSSISSGTPRPGVGSHTGLRLANALDQSEAYRSTQDANVVDDERARFRAEMKERFKPGGRQVAATLQGLAALADRRVEEAMSRGAFANLPRGKEIERDHNANSPFINTTEYFMNKMIQRQDIVPPWIEKQQEVTSTANKFRSGLRIAWKRHVARTIASWGGNLESQMKLASEYAFAEGLGGNLQAADNFQVAKQTNEMPTATIKDDLTTSDPELVSKQDIGSVATEGLVGESDVRLTGFVQSEASSSQNETRDTLGSNHSRQPTVEPFRDPQWERTERAYHQIAIANLNSLTRSYNLMAPDMAKKPYFSLERELRACFAAVAPQVADAIKERALASSVRGREHIVREPKGVLAKFTIDKAGHVYDEQRPQYGFREFWRDLFSKDK
jgi:hypothetical protein